MYQYNHTLQSDLWTKIAMPDCLDLLVDLLTCPENSPHAYYNGSEI